MTEYTYARIHRTHGEVDQATLLQAAMRELRGIIEKACKRIAFARRLEEYMKATGRTEKSA